MVSERMAAGKTRSRQQTRDSALLQLIGKMKLIKHLELVHGFELRLFAGR
jgi:hypothetical protein